LLASISLSNIILLLTAIIALWTFISTSRKQRKIERNRMYQQLEFEAIKFFRWEASHRKVWIRMRNEYSKISVADELLIETWCAQALNLFELCIHNARNRTLPSEILVTWLPWIHDVSHEPSFGRIWPKLKIHYLPECGKFIECALECTVMENFISKICKEYKLKK
jgi:hypothetical protein